MKEEAPVIAPSNPDAPPDPNGRPSQSSAVARFYVCPWPDFYSVMNDCDREVYQWIEQIPWNSRPGYLSSEQQRIANTAYQQQYQQWSSCESGRYAGQTQPEPGLRLAVASRLAGGGIVRDDSASNGISARLSRQNRLTLAAPCLVAVRATSIATLPPPTTTTFPVRSALLPRLTLRRKSTPEMTPSASSPSTQSARPPCAPTAR